MNVPSTPVTMVEPALMESMASNVCAERGITTLPANHSSTNALATPVSMDTVKTKSMGLYYLHTVPFKRFVSVIFLERNVYFYSGRMHSIDQKL